MLLVDSEMRTCCWLIQKCVLVAGWFRNAYLLLVDSEMRTCCWLIQRCVVGLTFDMYVCISNIFYYCMCDKLYWTQNCGWIIIWQFFLMFSVDKGYQDGCHRMTSLTSNIFFFSHETIKPLYKMCFYNMFVFYVDQEWSLLHDNSSTWPNG